MLVPKRQRSSTYYFEKEKDLNSSTLVATNNLKNFGFEENSFMRRSSKNKSPYNSLNGRRESFSKNQTEIIEYDRMRKSIFSQNMMKIYIIIISMQTLIKNFDAI